MPKLVAAFLLSTSIIIPSVAYADPAPQASGGQAVRGYVQSEASPPGRARGEAISEAAQEGELDELDCPFFCIPGTEPDDRCCPE